MSEYIMEPPGESTAYWRVHEPIVRCRDCKHATPDTSGRKCYEGYLWCDELTEGIGFSVAPNDYCAWGERK